MHIEWQLSQESVKIKIAANKRNLLATYLSLEKQRSSRMQFEN